MKRVGFCFHPGVAGAAALAERLEAQVAARGIEAWIGALTTDGGPDSRIAAAIAGSHLLVCVGGDGSMLQAAAVAAERDVPVFGIRMGRLGFLAEATEAEAEAALRSILDGKGRIEQRTMVEARIGSHDTMHALNDVVIGHQHLGRTVSVGVRLGGVLLAEYRADAVIVATATGSTGYSLSVGGPILHPVSDQLIVVPVAPHLSYPNALVVPGDEEIMLELERSYDAVMIVDGRREVPVPSGTVVRLTRSARNARFVRLGGPHQFYANLQRRLGWLRLDHVLPEGHDSN